MHSDFRYTHTHTHAYTHTHTRTRHAFRHTCALLPGRPGEAFEYDDFQNFAGHFNFTGDARPSFSPPLACPRCAIWDTAPHPIGYEPLQGYTCQAPTWGPSVRRWCYLGVFGQAPCKAAEPVQESLREDLGVDAAGNPLMYYRAECVDNGRMLLTPFPPEPRQKGCVWLRSPIDIYRAFSTAIQFEVKGIAWDAEHGGGDGLAMVFQNDGVAALGGAGKALATAQADHFSMDLGIQNALALEVRTFEEQGFVARSCGAGVAQDPSASICTYTPILRLTAPRRAGPISLNTSCVRASAAFNALETSAPVYKFPPLDPQVELYIYIYMYIYIYIYMYIHIYIYTYMGHL